MPARRHRHGAEEHIGPEQFGWPAAHLDKPPRMPNVVQDDPAAGWTVRFHKDFRVRIARDPGFPRWFGVANGRVL
ncbi:MAG TPA: hypothetical protein VHG52_14980, partial [Thermomicrobiales bacterium]|nr:hypothetical protein [Thermomicrobiales bacterium]